MEISSLKLIKTCLHLQINLKLIEIPPYSLIKLFKHNC